MMDETLLFYRESGNFRLSVYVATCRGDRRNFRVYGPSTVGWPATLAAAGERKGQGADLPRPVSSRAPSSRRAARDAADGSTARRGRSALERCGRRPCPGWTSASLMRSTDIWTRSRDPSTGAAMRIAHLGPTSLPLGHTFGGAVERRMLELAGAQQAAGDEVVLFSATSGDSSTVLTATSTSATSVPDGAARARPRVPRAPPARPSVMATRRSCTCTTTGRAHIACGACPRQRSFLRLLPLPVVRTLLDPSDLSRRNPCLRWAATRVQLLPRRSSDMVEPLTVGLRSAPQRREPRHVSPRRRPAKAGPRCSRPYRSVRRRLRRAHQPAEGHRRPPRCLRGAAQ